MGKEVGLVDGVMSTDGIFDIEREGCISMNETLDKVRAKIAKNMPKTAHSNLKWFKVSNYCLKTECARFTVGKSLVDGKTIYSAWMGQTPLAVRLETADEAKQLCESHAANLEKAPVNNTVPAMLQKKSKAEQVIP